MIKNINQQILSAHADGNHHQLVRLYTSAADQFEENGDIESACFFLTCAYVFALETGSSLGEKIKSRLVFHGREN